MIDWIRTNQLGVVILVLALMLGVFVGSVTAALLVVNEQGDENSEIIARIEQESAERRDQICNQAEREHLASVVRLRRTYQYLVALTPEERQSPLNRAITDGLAETENEARHDVAPPFCDEPNTGLPEPDPKVPSRPRALVP